MNILEWHFVTLLSSIVDRLAMCFFLTHLQIESWWKSRRPRQAHRVCLRKFEIPFNCMWLNCRTTGDIDDKREFVILFISFIFLLLHIIQTTTKLTKHMGLVGVARILKMVKTLARISNSQDAQKLPELLIGWRRGRWEFTGRNGDDDIDVVAESEHHDVEWRWWVNIDRREGVDDDECTRQYLRAPVSHPPPSSEMSSPCSTPCEFSITFNVRLTHKICSLSELLLLLSMGKIH